MADPDERQSNRAEAQARLSRASDSGNIALARQWAAAGNFDYAEGFAQSIGNPFEKATDFKLHF